MSYQYWDEYKTGKPYSYAQNKRAERELELGRQVTIAYKGVPVHINTFEEKHIEERYQEIIKNQNKNKMKTSKIKSIQNNGTWKDLFKFDGLKMRNLRGMVEVLQSHLSKKISPQTLHVRLR